jgi:cell division protein FtsB
MKRFFFLFRNKFIVTTLGLLVWISFFDRNDISAQLDLHRKVKKLQKEKEYYIREIASCKKEIHELQSDVNSMEKFAREKYLMKKDNEDVFVIVYPKKKS